MAHENAPTPGAQRNSDSSNQDHSRSIPPIAPLYENANSSAFFYPEATVENVEISEAQVRNLVRRAALKPRRNQLLCFIDPVSKVLQAQVRLKNAPGGRVLMHPEDVATPLASALGSAFDRAGCLHKLGIAPAPFNGGVPDPFPRRATRP